MTGLGFDPAHVEPGGPVHRYPTGPLTVTKVSVGPWDNNAYLLTDPERHETLLVDAANDAERLLELLPPRDRARSLAALPLT